MGRRIFKVTDHVDHPGKLLAKKYLPAMGIDKSQAQILSQLTQMDRGYCSRLLASKEDINLDMARELGRMFRTTSLFWTLMQQIYNETSRTDTIGSHNRESAEGRRDTGGDGTKPTVRPTRV